MMKVDVVSVQRYDFKADDGKEIRGCKINYVNPTAEANENYKGIRLLNISATYPTFGDFEVVPGKYDLELTMVPGKEGKTNFRCIGARYEGEVDSIV